jgi:catechol 2,3-dioxygenase-like lactoylglutathione lyase family enzyme
MSIVKIHHATLLVDDETQASWFYGQILGLKAKPRPKFKFPGLFYFCGDGQELHLIISATKIKQDDAIFIRIDNSSDVTRNYIHRHVALVVSDFDETRTRLRENGIDVLFDAEVTGPDYDVFTANLIEGWKKMYGAPPLFCRDPFGNILEIIPFTPERRG